MLVTMIFGINQVNLLKKWLKNKTRKRRKIKELQDFIARFSANASKSKQATSRKKQLEKIELDDIQPSSRRYPYVKFTPEREIGNDLLVVDGISKQLMVKKF